MGAFALGDARIALRGPFGRRVLVVVVEGLALRRRCELHRAHKRLERGAALRLDDVGEARRLESHPFLAVALEGPPLVASVHLVDECKVAEHNALANRPVAAPEVLAKRVDVVDAHELVGVFLEKRVVLPVVAADPEPAVLLAFRDELPTCLLVEGLGSWLDVLNRGAHLPAFLSRWDLVARAGHGPGSSGGWFGPADPARSPR